MFQRLRPSRFQLQLVRSQQLLGLRIRRKLGL
jgi:hypothetical protein